MSDLPGSEGVKGAALLICATSVIEAESDNEVEVESGKGLVKMGGEDAAGQCLVCLGQLPKEEEKMTLLTFCGLLEVGVPFRSRVTFQGFCTPLCEECENGVDKIRLLLDQLKEIQVRISVQRDELKQKVLKNETDVVLPDESFEFANSVNSIRNMIRRDFNKGRGGRKPKAQKNSQSPGNSEKEAESASTSQPERKSSFGRIVKRPRYLISNEEVDEAADIVKTESSNEEDDEMLVPIITEVVGSASEVGDTGAEEVNHEVEGIMDMDYGDRCGKTQKSDQMKAQNSSLDRIQIQSKREKKTKAIGSMNSKSGSDESSRTYTNRNKMERHLRRGHPTRKVKLHCKTCNIKFTDVDEVVLHQKNVHAKNPKVDKDGNITYECEFCDMVFKNHQDHLLHRRRHTGERPFKCDTCGGTFISKERLEVHVEAAHSEVPPLKCDFCPRKFYRHHRLRNHTLSHTKERPYQCELCTKSFAQLAYLKYHQTTHKELNLAEFKCNECDAKFASPMNLRFHKETQHQKKYRFHCDTCGHGTSHMSHMKVHMRSHTGERPHVCSHCGKSFTRGSQLKIHVRIHTGERPYTCSVCGKSFSNKSKVTRHERIHSKSRKSRRNVSIKGISSSKVESTPQPEVPGAETIVVKEHEDIQVDGENNERAILKVDEIHGLQQEQEISQPQLITIEQSNGVTTYQVITANANEIITEPYTEFIVLNGDFTIA